MNKYRDNWEWALMRARVAHANGDIPLAKALTQCAFLNLQYYRQLGGK